MVDDVTVPLQQLQRLLCCLMHLNAGLTGVRLRNPRPERVQVCPLSQSIPALIKWAADPSAFSDFLRNCAAPLQAGASGYAGRQL